MRPHRFADLFPLMDGEAFDELVEDVRAHGLREPIVLFEGQVLDGRNRLRACEAAGVEPRFVDLPESTDPLAWVVSHNLHRRHLSASQRALLGAKLRPLYEEAARQRQGTRNDLRANISANLRGSATDHDGTRSFVDDLEGAPPDFDPLAHPPDLPPPPPPSGDRSWLADLPEDEPRKAAEDAARAVGVSARSVEHASKLLRDAPELVPHVEAGRLAVSTAAEAAGLPDRGAFVEVIASAADDKEAKRLARALLKEERDRKREAKKAARLAKLEAEAPEAVAPEDVDLRLCTVAELLASPEAQGAHLLMADPPWVYDDQNINGAAQDHYDGMTVPEIAAELGRAYDVAAEDAYLLVWVTFPFLVEFIGQAVTMRWDYKSGGAWHKTGRMGSGHHWRGDAEALLLFTKGKPAPFAAVSNGYTSERGEHSEKPELWLSSLVRAFSPPRGLVLDLYAGRAPLARACAREGRRYLGAEIDEHRHREGSALLALAVGEAA